MPKPIFSLLLAIVVSIGWIEASASNPKLIQKNEGTHPKNVNHSLAIVCPDPVSAAVDAACLANVVIPVPSSNDPMCPLVSVTNNITGTSNPPTGPFSPSTFTIVWTIMDDCGASRTCNQLIVISDNTAPVMMCPPNLLAECGIDEEPPYADIFEMLAAGGVITDNCEVDSITFTLNSVTTLLGLPIQYRRTYGIMDVHGNEATCMQRIVVNDLIPPTIVCPPNISIGNSGYGSNVFISVDAPATDDNCAVALITNNYNDTDDASDFYPLGTTFVEWEVTDSSENVANCIMSIIIFDNTPPVVQCPTILRAICTPDVPLAYADFDEFLAAGGTASDDVALDTLSFGLIDQVSDNLSCPETITRTYEISDTNGNAASCAQMIVVNDEAAPIIATPTPLPNINCNQPLPTPQTLLAMDNCQDFDATVEVLPFVVDVCNGYSVTYRWTAVDQCGNSAIPVSVTFEVLPDVISPQITMPNNITINTFPGMCMAPVIVSPLVATDNCSSFTVTNSFTGTSNASGNYPLGTTNIVWTVTDACNNSSTAGQQVTVIDNEGPDIACKQNLVIGLNDFPNNDVPAEYFIESVQDNCGGPYIFSARRMVVSCGVPTSNQLGNFVPFCCADVPLTDVMVEIRVEDTRGNVNTCMINVNIQDNIPASIVEPLPDVTISCGYPLNLNDLTAFGTYVLEGENRDDIILQDPGHPFYPPVGFVGQDGTFSENCPEGIVVTVATINDLDMCNTGTITRTFTITPVNNPPILVSQTITVVNTSPFDLSNISWPEKHVFFDGCNAPVQNPDMTGRPVLDNDRCSQAAATFVDLTFPHGVYCRVIRRTWTVIDWCQSVPNTNIGRWNYEQFINITNDVPPTIFPIVCRDTMICAPNSDCNGRVVFQASGTDDCLPVNITWSYKVDLNNNGTIDITGTGSQMDRTIARGNHRMIWEAKDGCGNISTCDFLFTVRECKSPTAIAINGLAINLSPPMAMVTINANDFNNGSNDNCTPASLLKFSFSSNVNDTIRQFDCSHVGNQPITFWVTDLDGNQSQANTFIAVQDNLNLCNNMNRIVIAGSVKTEDQMLLPETKILLVGGETEENKMTNEEGKYIFNNLGMYNNYEIKAERDADPMKGVSTLDLVLIQRHILGIESLNTPYKLLAADINQSKNITTADLVELRKLILGIHQVYPDSMPWKFVNAKHEFSDPTFPWAAEDNVAYNALDTNMDNADFIAVKMGDVNNSVSQELSGNEFEQRNHNQISIYIEDVLLNENELVSIPVKAENFKSIIGLQGTFELSNNMEYVGFEAVNLPIRTDQIANFEKDKKKYLTFAYHDMNHVTLADQDVMFNILVRPSKSDRLSKNIFLNNDVVNSKVYDVTHQGKPLRLQFTAKRLADQASVMQNQPNPFKEQTVVKFVVPSKMPVSIHIFDGAGRSVYKQNQEFMAGEHSLVLTSKELGENYGIFYCKIKAENLNEVIKLLRIE